MKMKFKAYKVLTVDNRSPDNPKHHYHPTVNKIVVEEGLHVYKSLKNLSAGNFGQTVWEVEVNKNNCICDKDRCVCKKIKFICRVSPFDVEDNAWRCERAYRYCRDAPNDKPLENITKRRLK